jgi:hypothetical protein
VCAKKSSQMMKTLGISRAVELGEVGVGSVLRKRWLGRAESTANEAKTHTTPDLLVQRENAPVRW